MDELISKAEVLKMIRNSMPEEITGALLYESVKLMEPEREIIHCENCKHCMRGTGEEYTPYGFENTYYYFLCDKHYDESGECLEVYLDSYCSFAERKEDNKQE